MLYYLHEHYGLLNFNNQQWSIIIHSILMYYSTKRYNNGNYYTSRSGVESKLPAAGQ